MYTPCENFASHNVMDWSRFKKGKCYETSTITTLKIYDICAYLEVQD
jgi:hypothetical protein